MKQRLAQKSSRAKRVEAIKKALSYHCKKKYPWWSSLSLRAGGVLVVERKDGVRVPAEVIEGLLAVEAGPTCQIALVNNPEIIVLKPGERLQRFTNEGTPKQVVFCLPDNKGGKKCYVYSGLLFGNQ